MPQGPPSRWPRSRVLICALSLSSAALGLAMALLVVCCLPGESAGIAGVGGFAIFARAVVLTKCARRVVPRITKQYCAPFNSVITLMKPVLMARWSARPARSGSIPAVSRLTK